VFFSNTEMGEVEVYSTEDGRRVGSVTVPGPLGLSLSPDNTLLAVGTSTPYVYFVDPSALHITGQVEIPPSYLSLPGWGQEAVMPYLMANGPMLIAMAYGSGLGSGNLVSYDRATNTFAQANPPDGSVGYGIYGPLPARSLDGKYLVIPTLGQTGQQLALYSADARGYLSYTPISNLMTVAANPDGTQVAIDYGGTITVFNRSLQQQYQYTTTNPPGAPSIVFSRDGKYLYVRDSSDIAALNAQTGTLAGYQGLSIASNNPGALSDVDESYQVIGANDKGAFVVSLTQLQSTVPPQLGFMDDIGSGLGNPNGGPIAGGTKVGTCATPGGSLLDSSEEAYFGTSPATNDVVAGGCITATTPAASTVGPVTVLLTDAKNNAVLLPNGFSYGPHLRWISPSALPQTVYDPVELVVDGIWPWQTNLQTVTIRGQAEIVEESVDAMVFNVKVYPGSPGWADLTLTLTDGSAQTVKNVVQFLAQDVNVGSGQYTSAVYDSLRDRFYLVGVGNVVAVFDPESRSFLQSLQSSLVSSNAVLGSVAITPDHSKLVVSDPTDYRVVVFDLASGTSAAANVLLSGDLPTLWGSMPVVTTNANKAFVLLLGWELPSKVREIDLSAMTVQARTDIPPAGPGILSTLPNSASSSGDGSVILFGAIQTVGAQNAPGYVWKYNSTADVFGAPIQLSEEQNGPPAVAVNADGSVLAAGDSVLGQDLEPVVPFWNAGPLENSLTASGALLYRATGNVEILESRNGRSLLTLPGFTSGGTGFTGATALAIDPSGRKILACGGNSLIYYELSVVPLAAATVIPAHAAPGETVTVRGNGFVSGTSATIGGLSAACTMLDDSTLQCVIPNVNAGPAPMSLTNPDGQTYSFENAMTVQ
jgi:WD40 repeat protein